MGRQSRQRSFFLGDILYFFGLWISDSQIQSYGSFGVTSGRAMSKKAQQKAASNWSLIYSNWLFLAKRNRTACKW